MDTREYRTIDKSGWGPGPWQGEPDKKQWQDEATGFPCLIHRGPGGHLCGYVGLPPGHLFYRMDYDDVDCDIDVHGGLTFAGLCSHGPDESTGICHMPGPGEPDAVWWLGFDCAHLGDMSPKYAARGTYRTAAFVADQCRALAKQLAAADMAKLAGAAPTAEAAS